jgi:hypothetical protein
MRDLEGASGTPNGLMHEHLEAARFYLLGCMSREYELSLKLAKTLLPDIEDENLRDRVAEFIQSQECTAG